MKKEEKETHAQVKRFFYGIAKRNLLIFVTISLFFVSSFFLWFSFFCGFNGMENF
jgi:hypothetical protein